MKNLKNKKRKGFTLVEIIIVVIIIGILAALIVPKFMDATQKAKKNTALAEHRTVVGQVVATYAAMSGSPEVAGVFTKLGTENIISDGKAGDNTTVAKGTHSVSVTTTIPGGLEDAEKKTGGTDATGGSADTATQKVTYIFIK